MSGLLLFGVFAGAMAIWIRNRWYPYITDVELLLFSIGVGVASVIIFVVFLSMFEAL